MGIIEGPQQGDLFTQPSPGEEPPTPVPEPVDQAPMQMQVQGKPVASVLPAEQTVVPRVAAEVAGIRGVPAPVPAGMVSTTAVATQGPGRGNEMVDAGNTTLPRISQLQALSPQIEPANPDFMPGANIGDWINTVSKFNYGQNFYAINVFMRVTYAVWKIRKSGGGLVGVYPSQGEAEQVRQSQVPAEQYEVVESHDHVLLIKDAESLALSQPVMFSMTKSKLVQSRKWNSEILQQGHPDRFAKLWQLSTVSQSNKSGQFFKGVNIVATDGWVTETDFQTAINIYTSVSGINVT